MNDQSQLSAQDGISALNLKPLPQEGGFYRETYRSSTTVKNGRDEVRPISTAIYFLITDSNFSALHRLKYPEIFHFYAGSSAEMLLLYESGEAEVIKLGNNFSIGETPQLLVPENTWQGVKVKGAGAWCLLGTTMSPGFDFADFELGRMSELVEQYPHAAEKISHYVR